MKNLTNLVTEMKSSDYNEEEYRNSDKHKKYRNLANEYLSFVGKDTLKNCIDKAVMEDTNSVLKVLYDNGISEFVNGQMLGRIIERKLALRISDKLNGCKFVQGNEGLDEKDINCTEVTPEFKDNMKTKCEDLFKEFNLDDAHSYGIELKCSQGTGITGNKSYALDIDSGDGKGTKRGKNAFYILINYTAPIEIPLTVDDQTKEKVKKNVGKEFKIKGYDAYFGFIEQNDWVYGEKGNAASLKMNVLRPKDKDDENSRLIMLNNTRKN